MINDLNVMNSLVNTDPEYERLSEYFDPDEPNARADEYSPSHPQIQVHFYLIQFY